jgi:hypothetical protein
MADTNEDGVLINDGDAVYFIPSERLGEFRVDDDAAAGAQAGFEALDSEVSGFAMEQFASKGFDLKPGVVSMTAFRGPLAVKGDRGTLGKTKTMYSLG